MKLKALVLAAGFAAAALSNSASALVINGIDSTNQARGSDLILTVYDAVKDLSYVQDLGAWSSFSSSAQAGTFSGSFNLNATGLSVFSSSNLNNIVWTLSASNKDDITLENSAYISTSTSGAALRDDPFVALDDVGQSVAASKVGDLANAVKYNHTPIQTSGTYDTGAASSALSSAVKDYGTRVTYQFSFENSAKASVAQNLWYWGETPDGSAIASAKASANSWVLNLSDLSNATLSSAPVNGTTPLPAAAWLMFSALLGLGGIARRRNNA